MGKKAWFLLSLILLFADLGYSQTTNTLKEYEYFPGYIMASSYLHCTWNRFEENYLPQYTLDGRPETAWVEDGVGENQSGVGEYLYFSGLLVNGAKQLKIKIRNGYQKSEQLYLANSRPKELEVYLNSDPFSYEETKAAAGDGIKPKGHLGLAGIHDPDETKFKLNHA